MELFLFLSVSYDGTFLLKEKFGRKSLVIKIAFPKPVRFAQWFIS